MKLIDFSPKEKDKAEVSSKKNSLPIPLFCLSHLEYKETHFYTSLLSLAFIISCGDISKSHMSFKQSQN